MKLHKTNENLGSEKSSSDNLASEESASCNRNVVVKYIPSAVVHSTASHRFARSGGVCPLSRPRNFASLQFLEWKEEDSLNAICKVEDNTC